MRFSVAFALGPFALGAFACGPSARVIEEGRLRDAQTKAAEAEAQERSALRSTLEEVRRAECYRLEGSTSDSAFGPQSAAGRSRVMLEIGRTILSRCFDDGVRRFESEEEKSAKVFFSDIGENLASTDVPLLLPDPATKARALALFRIFITRRRLHKEAELDAAERRSYLPLPALVEALEIPCSTLETFAPTSLGGYRLVKHLAREAKCPDTALDKARQAIAKNGTSHARAEVCTDALESHIPLDPNALLSSALADPGTFEARQPTSTIAAGPFVIPSDYVRPRGTFVAQEACVRGIGDRHVLALTWQNRLEPTYLLDVAYFGTPAKVAVFNRPAPPKSGKAKPKELVVATSEPASGVDDFHLETPAAPPGGGTRIVELKVLDEDTKAPVFSRPTKPGLHRWRLQIPPASFGARESLVVAVIDRGADRAL